MNKQVRGTHQFVVCRLVTGRWGLSDGRWHVIHVSARLGAPVHGLWPVVDVLQEQTAGPRILPGMEYGRYDRIRWRMVMMVKAGSGQRGSRRRRLCFRLDQPAGTKQLRSRLDEIISRRKYSYPNDDVILLLSVKQSFCWFFNNM